VPGLTLGGAQAVPAGDGWSARPGERPGGADGDAGDASAGQAGRTVISPLPVWASIVFGAPGWSGTVTLRSPLSDEAVTR